MNVPEMSTDDLALLLVDFQNAFLDPAGYVARRGGGLTPSLQAAIRPAKELLDAARRAGLAVIHTQHAFEPGYRDGGFITDEIFPRRLSDEDEPTYELVTGSWEADFLTPFAPIAGETIIHKNRYDAFLNTSLQDTLERLRVRTLLVAGVATTMCVESTVREAAMRDYRVFLAADAVGDMNESEHLPGIRRLTFNFAHPTTVGAVQHVLVAG